MYNFGYHDIVLCYEYGTTVEFWKNAKGNSIISVFKGVALNCMTPISIQNPANLERINLIPTKTSFTERLS